MNETALATTSRGGLIKPVAAPAEVLELQKAVTELITKALEDGRDYGLIPGTKRPTLYKPGAERIGLAFGTYPKYTIESAEIDHHIHIEWIKGKRGGARSGGMSIGLYRYIIRAEIIVRATGEVVGDGLGGCSSLESKYIDRPRDVENTILKMACKRAMIAATLNAYALSDRFTQDLEDTAEVEVIHTEGGSSEGPKPPGAATEKQIERIRALSVDPLFSEDQRAKLAAALNRELNTRQAGALIGKAKKALEELKQTEAAQSDLPIDDPPPPEPEDPPPDTGEGPPPEPEDPPPPAEGEETEAEEKPPWEQPDPRTGALPASCCPYHESGGHEGDPCGPDKAREPGAEG